MIVLDTNVLSALMRSPPDEAVVQWLDTQPSVSVWTTSVTVFEVLYGLRTMAQGKRQRSLEEAFERAVRQDLEGRVFDFDAAAAREAALVSAALRAQGRAVDIRDVQIAGIVAARNGKLATRNTKHFVDTGVALVNPWETSP